MVSHPDYLHNLSSYRWQIETERDLSVTPVFALAIYKWTGSAHVPVTRSHYFNLTDPASPPDDELSTGAKAGIGVGVGVAGLIVLAAVVFFVLRSRRKRKAESQAADNPPPDTENPTDKHASAHELESPPPAPELPGTSNNPVELP
ncbi:hypothetical protein PHISP_08033 [Aspergillus sp. HF37]|nr:hypothetical protein PHISP_08033 [Aspergillus sp. HF37]